MRSINQSHSRFGVNKILFFYIVISDHIRLNMYAGRIIEEKAELAQRNNSHTHLRASTLVPENEMCIR